MKPRHAAALALAVIVAAVVAIRSDRWTRERHKLSEARAQIAELQIALKRYRSDYGYYPTTELGLSGLGEYYEDRSEDESDAAQPDPGMVVPPPPQPRRGPHPTDPWGRPFYYQSDGETYVLESYGPTGHFNPDDLLIGRSPSN